jgi:hypothetical protein
MENPPQIQRGQTSLYGGMRTTLPVRFETRLPQMPRTDEQLFLDFPLFSGVYGKKLTSFP